METDKPSQEKQARPPPRIHRLSARFYYGHRAPGQVVLVNGHVEFHGNGWDARKFEARIRSRFT